MKRKSINLCFIFFIVLQLIAVILLIIRTIKTWKWYFNFVSSSEDSINVLAPGYLQESVFFTIIALIILSSFFLIFILFINFNSAKIRSITLLIRKCAKKNPPAKEEKKEQKLKKKMQALQSKIEKVEDSKKQIDE